MANPAVTDPQAQLMFLVDSDILVDFLRGYAQAGKWLRAQMLSDVLVSGFVAMELYQGCANKAQQRGVRHLLADYAIIWPTAAECDQALATFATGHLSHALGLLDALIGQQAVSRGLPLYTFNAKHFAAIPGLQTIQPYVR